MKYRLTAVLGAGLWAGAWAADTPVVLSTDSDRISYSLGYQIGGDFKRQKVELNAQAVVKGIADATSGAETLMTEEEMRATLVKLKLKRKVVEDQRREARRLLQKELDEGKAFLAENAKKEGVVSRPSGLQYKVFEAGTGKSPGPGDSVTLHYRGTLVNGNPFYDTADDGEPTTFSLDEVIPGWQEALPLMKEGAKWQLFLPPDLGFGERTPLRDRVLIFDIELISVGEAATPPASEEEAGT